MKRLASSRAQVVRLALLVKLLFLASLAPAHSMDASRPIRLVAYGDSLTAGYMLKPSQSFPAQLAAALKERGHAVEVANAGVSGDTATAGLERFDWAVPDDTEAVILELGANDALRGVDPKKTRASLEKIVEKLRARNIEVLLVGMKAPHNMGVRYENDFNAIYEDLAKKYGLLLYPFFLDGVAFAKGLNLDDGMHPTAKGVHVIVDRILPTVEELIARVAARRLAASKS
jgi:acyl-CoA thioesterase-1